MGQVLGDGPGSPTMGFGPSGSRQLRLCNQKHIYFLFFPFSSLSFLPFFLSFAPQIQLEGFWERCKLDPSGIQGEDVGENAVKPGECVVLFLLQKKSKN